MDIEHYLHAVREAAQTYATAKATATYMEPYRRAVIALQMKVAEGEGVTSAAAQEREALASHAYELHLKGLRVAVEEEAVALWALKRAEMKIEMWRTEQATKRTEMKGYGT